MKILNEGNNTRLLNAMKKAQSGERVTIGYLGGSITMGSLASAPEKCYAYLSWLWWKEQFPHGDIHYVNAGIGGTTSHFGAARVEEDLLHAEPDVVFVEFSVNDDNTEHFLETYEGLIRHLLQNRKQPAVILLHNAYYDDWHSAQEIHSRVGRYYNLPYISFGDVLRLEIADGRLQTKQLTPDFLHPNDYGHRLLADMVWEYLDEVRACLQTEGGGQNGKQEFGQNGYQDFGRKGDRDLHSVKGVTSVEELPNPLTLNRYEHARRFRNQDIQPLRSHGFIMDEEAQKEITEIFKKGWMASEKGAEISFRVNASCIALQYRKTIQHPAPKAIAFLDGEEEKSILLDGDFEENWGDCLYLQILCENREKADHEVTIRLVEAKAEDVLPFYLVSLLTDER